MARKLDVYLGPTVVGTLEQTDTGKLRFRYAAAWIEHPDRLALSQSLPIRAPVFNDRESRPFFAGLLPEADKRALVAKALGISKRNDFAMLDRIGGECAGAISLLHAGEAPPLPTAENYRPLDEDELSKILEELHERPLLAGEDGIRLSLAGAQEKIPLLLAKKRIALPLQGVPSSHILKPSISRFAGIVANEDFCLRLARAAGLPAANAEIGRAKKKSYLLVERYDRQRDAHGALQRIHQEDFCQALGVPPEFKYQSEGGPTLKVCFALVRRVVARPVVDLARLLDAVIFNLLIGNNDAHGKNFSFLYSSNGATLAPLYDLSSTVAYPALSTTMAMKVGGADRFDKLTPRHWEQFAIDAGLGPAQVRQRVIHLARSMPGLAHDVRSSLAPAKDDAAVLDSVVSTIENRAENLLHGNEHP